jgi:hypothetical protein
MGFLLLCLWRGPVRWMGMPVMVVAFIAVFFAVKPAAMLDAEGRSLAIARDGVTVYAFKTPTKFVRDNWNSLWGGVEADNGKPVGHTLWQRVDVSVQCDDFACRISKGAARLSVLKNPAALREECGWASLVVALDKGIRKDAPCAAPVVPYWDVRDGGGMAFYADGDVFAARPMTPVQASRPWTLK